MAKIVRDAAIALRLVDEREPLYAAAALAAVFAVWTTTDREL